MVWTIEEHERSALANAHKERFRKEVVEHVLAKLKVPDLVEGEELRRRVDEQYEKADAFLSLHPKATYKSYVFMTLIFCVLPPDIMETPEPWVWLNNMRIGINTRVNLAYKITRTTINRMA